MNLRLLRLAPALLLSAVVLDAESATPAHADDPPPYELKNRSSFAGVDSNARAPFWPIGWVKRKVGVVAQTQAPVEPKVVLDGKNFKVTSILLGSGATPSLAVINGRAYSEGEFLRMPRGTPAPLPRIRVQRINDGNVILQNADQILVANLQRPELNSKRPEELLLDPDR
jgi:hypothetical protein